MARYRIDYCNALYLGLPLKATQKLQQVQKVVARLELRVRKYDCISPILTCLHWLPVCFHVNFKELVLTYKALHGFGPHYLLEHLTLRLSDQSN